MSRETYIKGFCKVAEGHGIDPVRLAKYASVVDDNLNYAIDGSLDPYNQYQGGPKPALADTIPGMPEEPKKPTLITNPGKLGVEANKRMMDEYAKEMEKFKKALSDRDAALEARRNAIIANAEGAGTAVPAGVPHADLATWHEHGVPTLARAIAEGYVPNQKYDYTSGTNALTQAANKLVGARRPIKRNFIEAIREMGYRSRGPHSLDLVGLNMRRPK